MLIPNHPGDERLSAMASRDEDALADAELVAHLSRCTRCTDLVAELGALRASLAELPDVLPSRPLRLLPPTDEPVASTDGLGGWARRVFAPLMTAGAALALVGAVGTGAPALGGMASGGGAAITDVVQEYAAGGDAGGEEPQASDGAAPAAAGDPDPSDEEARGNDGWLLRSMTPEDGESQVDNFGAEGGELSSELPAERSPWPMVLFSGIALIVAAALLRWILVPRAG